MSIVAKALRGLMLPLLLIAAAVAAMASLGAGPAGAHAQHKQQQQAQQAPQGTPGGRTSAAMEGGPTAMHGQMGDMMQTMEQERAAMSFGERLLSWLGRLHPVIVHFPIAFFPAALVTAIVGRRRPAFSTPVRFLVVAGGIIAPAAAILGWFDAIGAETDPVLAAHRWLGTAIGAGGLALAIWAWRRPDRDRSAGMIAALSAMTAAIIVQGWFGGEMVHGMGHMNW